MLLPLSYRSPRKQLTGRAPCQHNKIVVPQGEDRRAIALGHGVELVEDDLEHRVKLEG